MCSLSISLAFVANPEPDNFTIQGAQQVHIQISILSINSWIVISQRVDGSMSFNRSWSDYKTGFGIFDNASSNFWLGNEKVHQITRRDEHRLRIEFRFKDTGGWYSAEYESFSIDDEDDGYMLHLDGFSGDVGDALTLSPDGGADGMKFSTPDADNDKSSSSCAKQYRSGWWMNKCYSVNLNGIYSSGIYWDTVNVNGKVFPGGTITEVRMMVSKRDN